MSMLVNPHLFEVAGPAADVLIDTALFSANTSSGNQTFNIPAFGGKVPKAAMFEVVATTVASEAKGAIGLVSKGFTDGTTHYAMYHNLDLRRRQQKSSSVVFGYDGTTAFDATFVSFGTDEVTINWSTAPASAWKIRVYLFGGDDLESKVNYVTGVATTGTVVAVGFEPNFVFALSVCTGSSLQNGVNGSMSTGIIGNDGAGGIFQRVISHLASSGSGWDTGVYSVAVASKSGTGTPSYTISLGSFDASGFTATANNATPAAHHSGYLSIRLTGSQTAVGAHVSPTTDSSNSLTGLPFQPSKVFWLLPAANGTDQSWQGGGWGYMASGNVNSNQLWLSFSAATINLGYSTTRLRSMSSDNSANSRMIATLTSFNSDGWTLNWVDVNNLVGATWFYIAIE